jgi:hypothetical protein
MKAILFFIFLFFIPIFTFSQVIIDGRIRPRVEYRDGYIKIPTAANKPAFFVSQQTQLGVTLKKDNLQGRFRFQDARIWGGDNSLSLYEAWAEYSISNNFAIKFGRQEFQYDDGRLISRRPRRQDGFYYDALLFQYAKDSLYVDAAFSINNSKENLTGNLYAYAPTRFKTFNFFYLKKYFNNGFDVAITGISSGFQKENTDTTFYKQTIGTKLDYQKNNFSASSELFYQSGKHKDGRSVNAYLITIKAAYQITKKVNFTIGTEVISGHDATNSDADYQNTTHVFDNLEGAKFRYSGRMNYFRNYEKDTGGGGLMNYYSELNIAFSKKLEATLYYHYFDFQKNVFNNNGEILDKHLASEFDLLLRYRHSKNTDLSFGYSLTTPTNSLEFIQNIPTNEGQFGHYLWLMTTVNFENFKL